MLDRIKIKFKRSKWYSTYQKSALADIVEQSRQTYRVAKKRYFYYSYLFCRKPLNVRQWKGKVHFITFGSEKFRLHLQRIYKEAKNSGFFDTITILTDKDLPEGYKSEYSINESTRGFGYWVWKSYITKLKLEEIAMGDVLIYLDAGCSINKQGKKRYFDYLDLLISSSYSTLSFQTSFAEKKYTKGDLFEYLGLQYNDLIKNSFQLSCCPFILKKNTKSIELVNQWYLICHKNTKLINDLPSIYPNDSEFIEHRHDQSVFSLLRKMRGTIEIKNEIYFYKWKEYLNIPFHIHRFK